MIIDTSALMAVLLWESDAAAFALAIASADEVGMSAASWVELTITGLRRTEPLALDMVDGIVERLGIEILPVTVEEGRAAREAFLRYGRGRHPAALNYGDCFAYAAAKARGRPLLFKGDDFARTDVVSALPTS